MGVPIVIFLSATEVLISVVIACSFLSFFPLVVFERFGFSMVSSPVGKLMSRSTVCFTFSISESNFDKIIFAFLSRPDFKELTSLVITESESVVIC